MRMSRLEAADQIQRPVIIGARPGLAVQGRRRLQVMVEHVGRRFAQSLQRNVHSAAEIRGQDFDPGGGGFPAHCPDAIPEVPCPAVAQVVPVNGSDDHVFQAHQFDGFGQVFRFVFIQGLRTAVSDVTERAAPGAGIAHDHEGGGAPRKTLTQVGTGRLLAHRVQGAVTQQPLQLEYPGIGGRFGPDPGRFLSAALPSIGTTLIGMTRGFEFSAPLSSLSGFPVLLLSWECRNPGALYHHTSPLVMPELTPLSIMQGLRHSPSCRA